MAILPAAPQQQTNNSQQTGTGYTNIQNILNANQNSGLGQTVSAGVQQAGQAASGSINAAGQQFGSALGQEQGREQSAANQANNMIQGAGSGTAYTTQQAQPFQNVIAGQYLGPSGLNSSPALQNQVQSAQALGQATQNQQGRYGLLQQFVGNGQNTNYGIGQQSLDNLVLGQNAGALQQAQASTAGLGSQYNNAVASSNAQAQNQQAQAQQLGQGVSNNLANAVSGYDTQMQGNVANAAASAQSVLNTLGGGTNNTGTNAGINLTAGQLQQLSQASNGILNSGTDLYNANITPFVSLNTLFNSPQDIQNAQNFQQISNLGTLAGQTGLSNNTSAQSLLNSYINNPSAVGQYAANNPFSVSSDTNLQAAITNAQNAFNSAQGANNSQIENFTSQLGNNSAGNPFLGSIGALLENYGNPNLVHDLDPYSNGELNSAVSATNTSPILQQLATTQASAPFQSAAQASDLVGGTNYLNNEFGSLMSQLPAAEQWGQAVGGSYADMANQIGQEQNQLQTAMNNTASINNQFNVLRTLGTSPTSGVTANPIQGQNLGPVS